MGGADGHIAHFADLSRACAGKDTVGQNINMELPQVEAPGHDLHGLLHPEHLGAVFQQRLACRHNKIHNAAALFLIGIKNPLAHRRPPYRKVINDTALFYHVRNWRTRGRGKIKRSHADMTPSIIQ